MGTSPQSNATVGTPYQLSSIGGVAKPGAGVLQKIFASGASSTPTITVYDGATAGATGTVLVPTFTPVAGTVYNFDIAFQLGLNIVIGGTVTGFAAYA